ncbi:hypothetical protein KM043_007902 [Ampulex compressa]|nr:hypothetical protein KM043_007902 [Ampulex compressa]
MVAEYKTLLDIDWNICSTIWNRSAPLTGRIDKLCAPVVSKKLICLISCAGVKTKSRWWMYGVWHERTEKREVTAVCFISALPVKSTVKLHRLRFLQANIQSSPQRYRLEHEFDGMHTICNARKVLVIRIRMRRAVLLHLRCIEILEYGKSIFALSYLIQLIVIVIVLAGMLYNVYLLLVSGENMLAVAFILDLVGHYILLYMNILPGQRLIEDSSELYSATYNGRWYEAPLKAQKLVMFLLMQTRKPYVLTASGLVDMSVETLSMIVRISFSYFMLIRSTQG